MIKDKLFSFNFCYILAANFLLFFAFYLLLPVLPFYLKEQFMAGKSMIGFILSCYTLAVFVYPAFFRVYARYFQSETFVSARLFCLHRYFRRVYVSRSVWFCLSLYGLYMGLPLGWCLSQEIRLS